MTTRAAVPTPAPTTHRGLWPRSLLGRNLLLMAVLIVLGQLCAAVLVRHMILKPRVAQVADGVARNVAAIRAGLQALPPPQRQAFVQAFNTQAAQTQARALAAAPGSWRAVLSPLEQQFVRAVTQRLRVGHSATDRGHRRSRDPGFGRRGDRYRAERHESRIGRPGRFVPSRRSSWAVRSR